MTNPNTSTYLSSQGTVEMPENGKFSFILGGPNGGGIRKTKEALMLGSILEAAGRRVLYVCADRGIGSLSASLRVGGPYRVEFLPEEQTADYADTLEKIAKEDGYDAIVIDPGANEMLNGSSRRTITQAMRDCGDRGHNVFVCLSLVAGKTGLEDDAVNYARQMAPRAKVMLALHGAETGVDFSPFQELIDIHDCVTIREDQPAILNLIAAAQTTPFDWCRQTGDEFTLARRWMAHNLLCLAREPAMSKIVDTSKAIPVLEALAANRPSPTYENRILPWQVKDEVLDADARHIRARTALEAMSLDASDAELASAARNYLRATHARIEAQSSAKNS